MTSITQVGGGSKSILRVRAGRTLVLGAIYSIMICTRYPTPWGAYPSLADWAFPACGAFSQAKMHVLGGPEL